MRTTHTLERLIEEARRRTKVQGALGGEQAGLALIYAVTLDAAIAGVGPLGPQQHRTALDHRIRRRAPAPVPSRGKERLASFRAG